MENVNYDEEWTCGNSKSLEENLLLSLNSLKHTNFSIEEKKLIIKVLYNLPITFFEKFLNIPNSCSNELASTLAVFAEESRDSIGDKYSQIYISRYLFLNRAMLINRIFSLERISVLTKLKSISQDSKFIDVLSLIIGELGCKFSYRGELLSTEKTLANKETVGVIIAKCQELCNCLLGYNLSNIDEPIKFLPFSLLSLLILDTLCSMQKLLCLNINDGTKDTLILDLYALRQTHSIEDNVFDNKFIFSRDSFHDVDKLKRFDLKLISKNLLTIELLSDRELAKAENIVSDIMKDITRTLSYPPVALFPKLIDIDNEVSDLITLLKR